MESGNRTLCSNFVEILGGTLSIQKSMCIAEVARNIPSTILESPRPITSSGFFAFNFINQINDTVLNFGDFPLLEKEVNPFINELRKQGINISAVKAQWVFNAPKIFHLNFRSNDEPLSFARKVRNAFKVLS
jgi:hypothetical protein